MITAIDPAQGPPGTVLRIRGQNFGPRDRIRLAGRWLPIRGRSSALFEVVAPARGSGPVTLVGPNGRRARSPSGFTVTYTPVVERVWPTHGRPGSTIKLSGRHFRLGDQVYIGDIPCPIRRLGSRSIVVEVPANARPGRLHLRRATARHYWQGHREFKFWVDRPPVVSRITPTHASVGERVVISGQHFGDQTVVRLGGRTLRLALRSDTRLEFELPRWARSGPLAVTTAGGTARTTNLVVDLPAVVTSFRPRSGPPGTQVTLYGRNFSPQMKVHYGGLLLPARVQTLGTATVTIPASSGSHHFRLECHGQSHRSARRFTLTVPTVHRPTAAPGFTFTFAPLSARVGDTVSVQLQPPTERGVTIYLNGRPLPKRVQRGGRRLLITVPGGARTGYLEVACDGQRQRARRPLIIRD